MQHTPQPKSIQTTTFKWFNHSVSIPPFSQFPPFSTIFHHSVILAKNIFHYVPPFSFWHQTYFPPLSTIQPANIPPLFHHFPPFSTVQSDPLWTVDNLLWLKTNILIFGILISYLWHIMWLVLWREILEVLIHLYYGTMETDTYILVQSGSLIMNYLYGPNLTVWHRICIRSMFAYYEVCLKYEQIFWSPRGS